MFTWRTLAAGLVYCCLRMCLIQCQSRVLFPAASRIRRGLTTEVNPTFHNSISDAHLLFEILMTGIRFEPSGGFSVEDPELSSLRKTRSLDIICEEIIPKQQTDVLRLVSDLSNHTSRLGQEDFERTMLTLVYASQQMIGPTAEHQKELWAQSFVGLYKAIKKDLTLTD
ncbi:unnamed protein product [Menidia menidia]|uniref:(Atlantic silverside) hypothetical protein n=1 Tax=Menidia menidia TaxID=238744 RepID=A0A8S4BFJ9_9TELE|nr:unnamed protein product [Menidia menidia]